MRAGQVYKIRSDHEKQQHVSDALMLKKYAQIKY